MTAGVAPPASVVVDHPGRGVSDELLAEARAHAAKQAAEVLAAGVDWMVEARRPTYAELVRRRAELGPMARTVDPAAAARWAAGDGGSS